MAGLIVCHQLILQPALAHLTSDAPVINLAGRQRMLSQKLAKAALALAEADDPAQRRLPRDELATTLQLWQQVQYGLQRGDPSLRLTGRNHPDIQVAFQQLEAHFSSMVHAAEQLIAIETTNGQDARTQLQIILDHEPDYLSQMHSIVGLYEADARKHVSQLQWLGWSIMAGILCILVTVQISVIRPAVQLVGREFAQSAARYQQLVESMSDGLVKLDTSGRIQFSNPRFATMLGHDAADLVGRPIADFLAEADRRHVAVLHGNHSEFDGPMEFALSPADGQPVATIVLPQRLCDLDGTPQGTAWVVTDISARKVAEQRNRELWEQLTHADRLRSMGEMAGELAHELNQPLGAVVNYAEGCLSRLTAHHTDPQSLEPALRGILRAAHRGGEIIRRVRRFGRSRPYRPSPESINELVLEVEQLCLPDARRHGIEIAVRLADDLLPIPVDGIQIQQVLTNLIQNSVQALQTVDALERRIELSTLPAPNGGVEITVSDTGPGLPGDHIEQVFEPFVTTKAEGMGLGLAIARSIVQAHGGRIRAGRNSGGGAAFHFSLPAEIPLTKASVDAWQAKETTYA